MKKLVVALLMCLCVYSNTQAEGPSVIAEHTVFNQTVWQHKPFSSQWRALRIMYQVTNVQKTFGVKTRFELANADKKNANWFRQAYLFWQVQGTELRAGRMFIDNSLLAPHVIHTITAGRLPFGIYAYAFQAKHAYGPFSLTVGVSSESRETFRRWGKTEVYTFVGARIAGVQYHVRLQTSDMYTRVGLDWLYNPHNPLYIKGAVYHASEVSPQDTRHGGYVLVAYEVIPRVEVHTQIDAQWFKDSSSDVLFVQGARLWTVDNGIAVTVDHEILWNRSTKERQNQTFLRLTLVR